MMTFDCDGTESAFSDLAPVVRFARYPFGPITPLRVGWEQISPFPASCSHAVCRPVGRFRTGPPSSSSNLYQGIDVRIARWTCLGSMLDPLLFTHQNDLSVELTRTARPPFISELLVVRFFHLKHSTLTT